MTAAELRQALRLIVIVDHAAARDRDLTALARAAAHGGATMLQLRAKSLGPAEEATVTHAATVLIAAYLAAVARLTGLSALPGPAEFAFDMLGALLEGVTMQVGLKAENAILVLTRFSTPETSVDAALFYLPDPDSLDVMLGRLGVL